MPAHSVWENVYKASGKIKFPVMVKPLDDGSSIAISMAKNEDELLKAVTELLETRSRVMIEEYIEGREVTVAVLGNKQPEALPLVEIRPKDSSFFDFRAKYEPGACEEICPAEISPKLTKKIQDAAIKIHKLLGCRGVTRSDFIIRDNDFYFLEINTIPGMTETSLVPLAASKAGISFSELLDKLIELALEK